MTLSKSNYCYIDGTLFCSDGLQSAYISRRKTGLALQYLDGHKIEIAYESANECMNAWESLREYLQMLVDKGVLLELHRTMLVRIDAIRHIEFDGIDDRFAVLYRSGECFVFDFESAAVALAMCKKLLQTFCGRAPSNKSLYAKSRRRADFWQRVTAEINGLLEGEDMPNRDYWTQIDAAVINAAKRRKG